MDTRYAPTWLLRTIVSQCKVHIAGRTVSCPYGHTPTVRYMAYAGTYQIPFLLLLLLYCH